MPNVAVERAFEYVSDFRHAAIWDPRVERAEKLGSGAIGVGTQFMLTTRLAGHAVHLPYRIERYEPPHMLVFVGDNSLMSYRDEIRFSATSHGSSFHYQADAALRGVFGLGDPIFRVVGPVIGDDACAGIQRTLRRECGDDRYFSDLVPRTLEIAALDREPVLRNLLITQSYHEISSALAELLGHENGNWSTFAVWASKTAGSFIRGEEVPGLVNDFLVHAVAEPGVLGRVARLPAEVAVYVREGNKQVFKEIGTFFAHFIETFRGHRRKDPKALRTFIEHYSEGPPRPDKIDYEHSSGRISVEPRGGQGHLRSMAHCYYEAMFEQEHKRKAELMLLGNAYGGLHEQTRLQSYIDDSINAPILDTLFGGYWRASRSLADKGGPGAEHVQPQHPLLRPLVRVMKRGWQVIATAGMMKMPLPDGVLRLGVDIPAPPGQPLFPEDLRVLEDHELIARLDDFQAYNKLASSDGSWLEWLRVTIARAERQLDIGKRRVLGSAATDWVSFPDRMQYILEYFRSRQQDRALLHVPPFSESQTRSIRRGWIPDGRLS